MAVVIHLPWWADLLIVLGVISPFAVFAWICSRLGAGPLERQLTEHRREVRQGRGEEP